MITATRYHDFSCGHRVHGHESKCALLHGHNYRAHFTINGELDKVGRVLDFSVINTKLCQWLEENWDHRFLAWECDTIMLAVQAGARSAEADDRAFETLLHSLVWVPFNPTAENMALYLLAVIGPQQLADTGATLIKVVIDETRKCSAGASL